MKEANKKILICIVGVIFMILSFNNNIFVSDLRGRIDIETFQVDSENLVIVILNRDKYNTNNNIFGLQKALRKI